MGTNVLVRVPETTDTSICRHYWMLEAPTGEMYKGVCKYCGALRRFPNSSQGFVGVEERSADISSWGAGEVSRLLEETEVAV